MTLIDGRTGERVGDRESPNEHTVQCERALAEPGCGAVGYVERDAFAAAVLVARMEDQTLD